MSVQRGVIDNRALSVVIALAGTYLALSLMVLCLVEMISSALSRRARFLRDGIVNLVGPEMGSRVLCNPLVSSLGFVRQSGRAAGVPSYVPSSFFSRALLVEIARRRRTGRRAGQGVDDRGGGRRFGQRR